MTTSKWTGQDGQEKYTTEIEATELQMLGRREGGGAPEYERSAAGNSGGGSSRPAPAASKSQAPASSSGGNFGDFEDDIPF